MKKAILFLTSELHDLSLFVYKKVQTKAKELGIPLLCYCGSPFHDEYGNMTPESVIYNYINRDMICGVIINGGAVGQFSSSEFLQSYVNKLSPLPSVSLSFPIENSTSILVDNYQGIYSLIEHLIKDHNYNRIAFVKGPDGHPEAEERFNAYKSALKDNNIAFDESLIAPGDFSEEAGEEAVIRFLKNGSTNIQAIACVDDDSALGVYRELKKSGLRIPRDIAVSGFDDIESTGNLIPSLTTVKQPYEELIEEAFNSVLKGTSNNKTVPTLSVLRESCGCRDKDILNADVKDLRMEYFTETREAINNLECSISKDWKKRLLDALESDINSDSNFSFIDELSVLIEEVEDFEHIHTLVSNLHAYTPLSSRSSLIFQQARLLVNKISNRLCILNRLTFAEQTNNVNTLISTITQVENSDELCSLLAEELPEFGINEFYIVIYGDNKESAELFLSVREGKIMKTGPVSFNPEKLLPESSLIISDKTNISVIPLMANNNIIGYGIYSVDEDTSGIIETINNQIGGELNVLNLKKQRELEKVQLEERNRAIQNVVKPMLNLIKQVSGDAQSEIKEMIEIKNQVGENNKNLKQTSKMLIKISDKINEVMESVSVINDISENVHVLAINTSIQSAHAGDFGKAFGVIAKEIRKLSDSTAVNAETITNDLQDTITEFKEFTQINNVNAKTFQKFSTQINHFMEIFNNIALNMETLSDNSLNIIDIMDS